MTKEEMFDQLKYVDKRFGDRATRNAIDALVDAHEAPEEFAEQLVTFSSVLKTGRYKASDYIKAVQYVSYRQMGLTIREAYKHTFPERCVRNGKSKPDGTINALSSLYDRTQLVQKVLTQVQIPLHIMMMHERVKAANVLARLMVESENERIRMESADKLLNHIKLPETVKVEMDVGIRTDETIKELNETLNKISEIASSKIQSGVATPVEIIEL